MFWEQGGHIDALWARLTLGTASKIENRCSVANHELTFQDQYS